MYPDGFEIATAKRAAEFVMQAKVLADAPSKHPDSINGYRLGAFFFDDAELGPKQRRMGYIASKGTETVIAIRGTANLKDVATDLKMTKTESPDFYKGMKFHSGCVERYAKFGKGVVDSIAGIAEAGGAKEILVCGHSLGGALAKLVALALRSEGHKKVECYTFGAPKLIADEVSCKKYKALVPNSFRVVNPNDPVPKAPLTFAHIAGEWSIPESFGKEGTIEAHKMVSYMDSINEYAKKH